MAADILSNVIDRGLAANKPTSPLAEGYIYYSTDTGALERYSGSTWESIAATASPPVPFAFSTTTTDADPGSGTLRFNNATPASVTVVYIDETTSDGIDIENVLANQVDGGRVVIMQQADRTKFIVGEVTAVADGTGYRKLTVTIEDSGTLPDNGATLSVVFFPAGGGGGGGGGGLSERDVYSARQQMLAKGMWGSGTLDTDGSLFNTTTPGTDANDTERCANAFVLAGTTSGGWFYGTNEVEARWNPSMRFDFKFVDYDDASWVGGFHSNSISGITSLNSQHCACLIFRNGTDTNYQFATNDGTGTITLTDTGVALDNAWHDVHIYTDDQGVTWYCYIDGTLVATRTTDLPTTSQRMRWASYQFGQTSSPREHRASYLTIQTIPA